MLVLWLVLVCKHGTCVLLQLQVWKATVYLTPVLGGYLADAVMGRFWVILTFSSVYFVVSTHVDIHILFTTKKQQ